MQIRNRLTYQFVSIVATLFIVAILVVLILFAQFRERDFYERLENTAVSTAKIVLEEKNIDPALIKFVDKNFTSGIPHLKVVIFDNTDKEIFNTEEDKIVIDEKILKNIRSKKLHLKI